MRRFLAAATGSVVRVSRDTSGLPSAALERRSRRVRGLPLEGRAAGATVSGPAPPEATEDSLLDSTRFTGEKRQ